MLAKESPKWDLPEELLEVLPSDPFELLDVARRITSVALSGRIDALESEASDLREQLAERDAVISGLEEKLESLNEAADKMAAAQQEKEKLIKENEQLSTAVKKLNRDVAKLEVFRKTLMKSLQEDGDNPAGVPKSAPIQSKEDTETEVVVPPPGLHGLLLASQTNTPRLTPTGSPLNQSASVSPSRTPAPLSPRRHSFSFSTARGFTDDKSLTFPQAAAPPSKFPSLSSLDHGPQPAKTWVDGKEFFRQVRTRLSYEQFGAFLNNVKELNSHKQSKEETLKKAEEIFGPENRDLYAIFAGLIIRNVQ